LGPVFFPAQGGLGHCAIQRKPVPVNAPEFLTAHQAINPELLEDPGLNPLLKAPVRRGVVANARRVQGRPLAAGAQHEEYSIHRIPVGHPRVVAPQGVRLARGQQLFHLLPQNVGNAPAIVFNY